MHESSSGVQPARVRGGMAAATSAHFGEANTAAKP
ncbi:hypothetical protein BN159_0495 [Streptomyces davaonensis JCM 4913]|uniref:Uncharacterized protein n=1 Tax=Streptomyces davaonensis (strain DSM 101723 / JCM 4913 / KCC S-0913 / 768) TaxID=1214101 RepID=K4QWY0_STRDJ|nr:hypothetical protein BN159_0495 [Streptomyces davaonensis JCM 4913]